MKILFTLLLAILLIQTNANVVDCMVNCAKKHLTLWEAARVIGTCKKDTKCYLKELKGKALECVQQCLSVSEISSVDQVAAELYSELESQNIFKCFGDCAKKHLSVWEALRIIGTCKQDKNCYLKELKGKALECAQQCLGKNDEVESELVKMVDEEKNVFKCIEGCVKKHLSLFEALRVIGKCKTDKNCYLKELKGIALDCVKGCLGKEITEGPSSVEEKTCEEHVDAVRKKFSELNREEKRAFVEKVYNALVEKHPNVDKTVVFAFVRSLFSPLPPRAVCALYDRIFKKTDEVDEVINEYEKGIGSCLKSCVKKHLSLTSALKLIAKCNVNKACYILNLGGKALDCVKQCV